MKRLPKKTRRLPLRARGIMPCRARLRGGFSLIEALIAVIVVTMGSIATIQLLAATHVQSELDEERARAHQLISEELEQIRSELFARLRPIEAVTMWDSGTPDILEDDTVGTMAVVMRDVNGNVLTGPPTTSERIEVEITLSWTPRGRLSGKTLSETLMTYITPK